MPQVMTEAEADKLFQQLENESFDDLDGPIPLAGDFEPGKMDTVYPGKLPGALMRIYDTKTGHSSEVLPYMLKSVMKMTHKDGSPRFSRRQTVLPMTPSVLCFLNPEHPEAEAVREAGITVTCNKKLLSVVHAERHAETRHSDNWKVYQRSISEKREGEQREFQRLQLEVLRKQINGTAPVAPSAFYCDAEGCPRFFDSAQGLTMHRTRDHKE